MTKQEAIKKAYGDFWEQVKEYVSENGWCNSYWNTRVFFNADTMPKQNPVRWRPISLNGIDNNNGWIKIESEDDLPKKGID